MGNIIFLSLLLGRLGDGHGVRAALHDVGHGITEAVADVLNAAVPTGIFAGIVEECANGFLLIRAVLQGEARDAKEVGKIWNLRVLSLLEGMNENCVVQGLVKFLRKVHGDGWRRRWVRQSETAAEFGAKGAKAGMKNAEHSTSNFERPRSNAVGD